MKVNNVCVADIVALYRREMQEVLTDLFMFLSLSTKAIN